MRISRNKLIIPVAGRKISVFLPDFSVDATVKAWKVPTDYRENGIFVSVTPCGGVEEIPACDPSETEFLGEVDLPANATLLLHQKKAAKLIEINGDFELAFGRLMSGIPVGEVQSWPQQAKEAEALAADPDAFTPLLTSIAASRGIAVSELAAKVMAKAAEYSAASGAIIGKRQALISLIETAETIDDILAVVW
jgi:hypothetical protein